MHTTPNRSRRPPVSFVTWSFVRGRSEEIAAALGGDVCAVYPRWLDGSRRAPLRYVVSAVRTVAELVRRRPRSVVVTNPPIFPPLIAWAYCRVARVPLVLDSHPGAFGRKDNRVAEAFMPVHRWLARRSAAVLVTTGEWVDVVTSWGGRGVVVHEAPPLWEVTPPGRSPGARPRVLFVGIFANDEPVEEVVEAARRLPEIDVDITGHIERAPGGLVDAAPPNVRFVGYLGPAAYRDAVQDCDLVLALTTEPSSVMRAAYEGVYARRPIVISDWPDLRAVFPSAVFTSNDVDGIERALRDAVDRLESLDAATESARSAQLERWEEQLEEIRRVVGLTTPERLPAEPGAVS